MIGRLCLLLLRLVVAVLLMSPHDKASIRMPGFNYREGRRCPLKGCAGSLKWNSQGLLQCSSCFRAFIRED